MNNLIMFINKIHLFISRKFIWFLTLINFDHKGFARYKPVVSNRFFFLYFKNKRFQVLTILFIEIFSLFFFICHINLIQFAYLYLLPVLVLYIRNTKIYMNLLSFFVGHLKRSLIKKLLALSVFIVFLYMCYLSGAFRVFAVIIITAIVLLFEAYRNMRLKADLDKPYVTKRVIKDEVSIRSEAELRLKYPFLKWFRDYVILRLMFCSSYYFMTKNGIILNEMLSICALSFVWGTIQPNLIQRYSNTPVVLEVLAELCRVPLTRVTESLIKEPFFIQQHNRNNVISVSIAKKTLEYAIRNRIITSDQVQDVVRKTTKLAFSSNKATSSTLIQQQCEILAQNKQLESIVREQAKEYTRALSNGTRIGILVSLGLAGLSMLDLLWVFK